MVIMKEKDNEGFKRCYFFKKVDILAKVWCSNLCLNCKENVF